MGGFVAKIISPPKPPPAPVREVVTQAPKGPTVAEVDDFSKRWNIALITTYRITTYEITVKAKIIGSKICFFELNSKRYWLKFSI